jgi:hypothetical protein
MTPPVGELFELAVLRLERRVVHRATVDARRRPRLEAADLQARALELFGEVCRRGLTGAAAGDLSVGADVDAAPPEGAGREDDRARAKPPSLDRLEADDAALVVGDEQPRDGTLDRVERRVPIEERAHGAPIEPAVALCTRRPHGGALAAVQHPELDRRHVGRAAHDAA